jgi:hypothetical protein
MRNRNVGVLGILITVKYDSLYKISTIGIVRRYTNIHATIEEIC